MHIKENSLFSFFSFCIFYPGEQHRAEENLMDSFLASKLNNRLLSRKPPADFSPEFLLFWISLSCVCLPQTSLLFYFIGNWYTDHITTDVLPNQLKPNCSTRLQSCMHVEESSFMGPIDNPGQSNNNKATSEDDLEFSLSVI